MDPTKITKLGWKPKHTMENGVEDTIKWYFDHKDWLYRILHREMNGANMALPDDNLFSIPDWRMKFDIK